MLLEISQYPETGKHLLRYCGDILEVRMRCSRKVAGTAFLSTNIGNAEIRMDEIIRETEQHQLSAGQDWANLPMEQLDDFTYRIALALHEPGHFECKVCFITDKDSQPVWAPGDNLHVNVISASYCCANGIYCAFPRQFGMNRCKKDSSLPDGITPEQMAAFDRNGYNLIPPSGTFRDVIRQLDHITNDLKCRILHLLPVNPTPTVYGRMGRYGSPYAALDFTAVDPSLAEFDKTATPLDQFIELTDAIHGRGAKIFIDIAINHTGWASKLQEEHPEWFVKEADGKTFHSPGAWGTVWEDLVELDSAQTELWQYLANVFLTWCDRGVDGFRCDAGYMIPERAWTYIIAKVRQSYPDTIFLLEGLGGDPAITSSLLDTGNMDWAYSELFQNYSRNEVENYLRCAWRQSAENGVMVHYAETHDNSRLAAVSRRYAQMRTALCALSSVSGSFGFANGVEWFATEKIDVHESRALNWGSVPNQVSFIARLNAIMAVHETFYHGAMLQTIDSGSKDAVIILRETTDAAKHLLVCVNLNCDSSTMITWDPAYINGGSAAQYRDLLTGKICSITDTPQRHKCMTLAPGMVCCLSAQPEYLDKVEAFLKNTNGPVDRLRRQVASAMAMKILCKVCHSKVISADLKNDPADLLLQSPEKFLREIVSGTRGEIPFIAWHFPADAKRKVMLPPDHCLLIKAPERFSMTLRQGDSVVARHDAVCSDDGRYFVLLPPLPVPAKHTRYTLELRCSPGNGPAHCVQGQILLLAEDMTLASISYTRQEIYRANRTFLQGNGRGAIICQPMELGRLDSRYDALLLANLSDEYPVDRHIMLRRIRIWLTYQARLQELKHDYISSFQVNKDGSGTWFYHCPVGNGLLIDLSLKLQIIPNRNSILITIKREPAGNHPHRLPDNTPIQLFVRPDIEDRNFHTATKAACGPEKIWPGKITCHGNGFEFAPANERHLSMTASRGKFENTPEWVYMIYQAHEAARGLDPHSDLYSPGCFRFYLEGDETCWITGDVLTHPDQQKTKPAPLYDIQVPPSERFIEPVMLHAMRQFVVKRGNLKTVIAGYPWFLDWGRDTLIAARGLLSAAEFHNDVAEILMQFASFAENGTIPNMISGGNASNRDTSDAPLWLFRAVADYCKETGKVDFLTKQIGQKGTLLDILSDLADGYAKGTPNGICMDPESGLIYSPPHFTWMDTNYPAGTPREGYPIEIQALWYNALKLLAQHERTEAKRAARAAMAEKVRTNVLRYYLTPEGWLSDCLHGAKGIPAAKAVADDHLRPNQLFAITLGLVDSPDVCKAILEATSELLIPGAIRTLADRDVQFPLPVRDRNGALLNNPTHPYCGRYEGDEDTRRKVAYHNGTAWPWVFPSWPEAYYMTYGVAGSRTAISVLSSMTLLMDGGYITQLAEILDGDYPHTLRGCGAQAWSITEFYRVWTLLHKTHKKTEAL